MGYKQIEGTAQLLVNEKGQVRDGLRNLPEDSDRFVYELDDQGNKKNSWPLLIVTLSADGEDEKVLLPEVVLKTHGIIPRKVQCSAGDFKSKSGSKNSPYDSAVENVEYKGDASADAKPYKDAPDKGQDKDTSKKESETDEPKSPPKTEEKVAPPPPEPKGTEDTPEKKVAKKEPEEEEEVSDLQKGSAELTATRAIEIIDTYELEELEDFEFFTEGKDGNKERVTVVEAWNKKKEGS